MTATLSQVREALAATLRTVEGLRAHAFKVGSINAPAAVITPATGAFLRYDVTLGDDTRDLGLIIGVFVQWGDDRAASQALDAYLADSGPGSIRAAIANDNTLGGVVDDCAVVVAQNYGSYEYGGVQYYGCELAVEVLL